MDLMLASHAQRVGNNSMINAGGGVSGDRPGRPARIAAWREAPGSRTRGIGGDTQRPDRGQLAGSAQRVTVLGLTLNMVATWPGVSRDSCSGEAAPSWRCLVCGGLLAQAYSPGRAEDHDREAG